MIHVRVQGGGRPLVLVIAVGQRHEQIMFEALIATRYEKRV